MPIPLNVDRPVKDVPWATYGLIAANVFVFLMTILVSNTNLPADREQGRAAIQRIIAKYGGRDAAIQSIMATEGPDSGNDDSGGNSASAPPDNSGGASGNQITSGTPDPSTVQNDSSSVDSDAPVSAEDQAIAELLVQKHPDTPDREMLIYQIAHVNDIVVSAPHYTITEEFAYHPFGSSPLQQIISIFTSMFMHESFEHLLGNMLFLWVFGRALEEFLGRKVYLAVYILCGVAATLCFHVVTVLTSAPDPMLYSLGASGAIAGLMGLFAVRYYWTNVDIYVIRRLGWVIVVLSIGFFYRLFHALTALDEDSAFFALMSSYALVYFVGPGWAWRYWRWPSVAAVGLWLVIFNLLPALWQLHTGISGGVAYWAHFGGLVCGAAYGYLVGGVDQGRTDYTLEDAHRALVDRETTTAISQANRVLEKSADNPAALEVLARSHDAQHQAEPAIQAYLAALNGYWKAGDRLSGARVYLTALEYHPTLPVSPAILAGLASFLMKENRPTESASALVRIIEEHPKSPEAEVAILRAGQMWGRVFNDPAEAARLYALFLERYPHSPYAGQTKIALEGARQAAERHEPR